MIASTDRGPPEHQLEISFLPYGLTRKSAQSGNLKSATRLVPSMRSLSLVLATLLLVGCAESYEPQVVPEEVDVQLQPSPDQNVEEMEAPEQIADQPVPIQDSKADEELDQPVTNPMEGTEVPRGLIDV
ncbi:MAG: hypothetical protein O2863_03560, partial [Actinomycetota bacterium]|nr:hypothetical protein [Actinomycetota bacterium]